MKKHEKEALKTQGKERSPEWSKVRKAFIKANPACAVCGHTGRGLNVHHRRPFHLHPELELDPANLITLCERPGHDHHFLVGHLEDFKSYNENVEEDAKAWYNKIQARP